MQRVGVLIAADRNVARKQRNAAAHDIDVHHAGADVEQRDGLAGIGIVIHFEAVLQREGVDIHDRGILPRLRQHVGVIQNLVFLDRHQQNVHLRIHGLEQLVIQVHVGNVERNVLAGFGLDAVVKLFLGHHRQRNSLDDHRVARNRRGHVLGLDFLRLENIADRAGDQRRVHDRAVHHRVLRQRFQPKTDQFIALFGASSAPRL